MASPWWAAELHLTALSLHLLNGREGENIMEKGLKFEIRTRRSLTIYHHRLKRCIREINILSITKRAVRN